MCQKKEVAEKLKKIVSKLKVGGYLYIAVKGTWPNGPEEEIKTENDYGYDYQRFFSYFTTNEIETHLRNLGLDIIYSDLTKSGCTDWIQVVGKKL